jgi:hypothetical protein
MADFPSDDTQILRDHAHLLFFIWIPSWFATMGCPDRRRRMMAQKKPPGGGFGAVTALERKR